ncbi:MAG: hypothetical protein AAF668_17250 [Pseudomonadota bacterium]
MPNITEFPEGQATNEFDDLPDQTRRMAIARYLCRAVLPDVRWLSNEKQTLATSRLLCIRSTLSLIGKLHEPRLSWPDTPSVEIDETLEIGDHSASKARHFQTLLMDMHRGRIPSVKGMSRHDTIGSEDANVIEVDGFEKGASRMKGAPLFPNEVSANWIVSFEGTPTKETEYWFGVCQHLQLGTFDGWDLLSRVVSIAEKEWAKGPIFIANKIEEIQGELDKEVNHSDEKARSHASVLLNDSLRSQLTAQGLSDLISMAVDAYRREISNALPDALEPLEQLPPILDQISLLLAGNAPKSDKEDLLFDLVTRMAQTIRVLNRRLELASLAQRASKERDDSGSGWRLFADAFYTSTGTGAGKLLSSKLLWGGVIAGGTALVGVGGEAATEHLARLCNEVILPESTEAVHSDSVLGSGPKFVKPPVR